MKKLAISALFAAAAVLSAAALANDENLEGRRVSTPKYDGGVIAWEGAHFLLSPKGYECKFAKAIDGEDVSGWYAARVSDSAYVTGCWTHRGHIIILNNYLRVEGNDQSPHKFRLVLDVPSEYYK